MLIVWSAVDECAAYLVIRYEVTVEPSDAGLAQEIVADEAVALRTAGTAGAPGGARSRPVTTVVASIKPAPAAS